MPHFREYLAALSAGLAIPLAACGGGGGGSGPALVSAPPPAPTPTPVPAPSPAAGTIGAPALAAMPNPATLPVAVAGGPTMQAHSLTTFPLLQSVVSIGSTGAIADQATISNGGTLAFDSSDTRYVLNLANPVVSVSNVQLNAGPGGGFGGDAGNGKSAFLDIADPATSMLSWTSYGFWDVAASTGARTQAAFVTGYVTPQNSVPTTGTATYRGTVSGELILPQAGRENGLNYLALSGDAYLDVDFAAGSVNGALREMYTTDFDGNKSPWDWVSLSGTVLGQNMFGGLTASAQTSGTGSSLASTATGTFAGAFFGPQAQELGAVWTLSDGTAAAFGTIGAANCSGCTPWDY